MHAGSHAHSVSPFPPAHGRCRALVCSAPERALSFVKRKPSQGLLLCLSRRVHHHGRFSDIRLLVDLQVCCVKVEAAEQNYLKVVRAGGSRQGRAGCVPCTVLIQAVMRLCVCARTCVCVRAACACVCAELHRDRWTRRKEQYYGQNLHVLRGLPLRFHVCHRPARVAFSLPGVLRR